MVHRTNSLRENISYRERLKPDNGITHESV